MPLIRKSSSASKHHPYLSEGRDPVQKDASNHRYNTTSRSLSNIANVPSSSSQEQFIPRSMSAIEENSEGWKLSFCGVLPTNFASKESKLGHNRRSFNSESDKSEIAASLTTPIAIPRSNSYQVTYASETKLDQLNSSPIPVPMRESRKRKSNFRSSGGYFFDKYMKRFYSKSTNKVDCLGHSKTADELKESIRSRKVKEVLKTSARSNRQDMLCNEAEHRDNIPYLCDEAYMDEEFDDDDLYPRRFGSSSCWSARNFPTPRNSLACELDGLNEDTKHPPLSSVFPSSPPRFWGDANHGNMDGCIHPASPVPSLTDVGEPACRYSDSNSETLKAMETLYLCNFHVTVEGDWLCLKEICEDAMPSSVLVASTVKDEAADVEVDEAMKNGGVKSGNEMKLERKNLLGMAKLSIKGLIESSLSAGHTLDSDHEPLQQFFVIIEYILRHGLKNPKNFFSQNKYFWPPLEALEKLSPEACEITNSARSLPGIRTHLGRGRAWLRLALMQKKLADYFKVFIESKEILSEWYDDGAVVMNDEAVVLVGHLVGLNCIDANLCMKGDNLDNQLTVIDYSFYMKDGGRDANQCENEEEAESAMQKLVNQKNYLEERNRHLETASSELQKKAELLESTNESLSTELEAVKIQLEEIKKDKERIVSEKIDITASHQKTLEDREKDLDTERETLRQSRAGLDEMYTQIQKQLKHETNMRMDVEKELQLQLSLKQELEMAMKLLEKDIYDKQDGLITLREQLDNVKAINLDIYNKLQSKTEMEDKKNKSIDKLQNETEKLAKQVAVLQSQLEESKRQTEVAREQADRYNYKLDESEQKRSALLTNLQIEREWREALQAEVEKHTQEKTLLNEKLQLMSTIKDELKRIELERDDLKETCHEQELTIGDLAGHLGRSKQDLGDLKEVHKTMTSSTWENDKEVKECQQCEKPFNLARRKHHCRNCGQIYCSACSDNTMPLASSAKPVRVCDTCHTLLLHRLSSSTS